MEGTGKPDTQKCVEIATAASLKEMVLPGIVAITSPILVGFFLGKEALGGMLAGATVTGVLLALFMANAGGAWDNAKKAIEQGVEGESKGTEAHKAAVTGDTVGDPFKDTSRPSDEHLSKTNVNCCTSYRSTSLRLKLHLNYKMPEDFPPGFFLF